MRLVFDHTGASAVRLSIAAAMVIAKPVYRKLFTLFTFGDFCKEMSTKSNDNPAAERWKSAAVGRFPAKRSRLGH